MHQLLYNVTEGHLHGVLAGRVINAKGGAGGRAGTTVPNAESPDFVNNPLTASAASRGPIPQGYYYMRPHESKAKRIRLDPLPENNMYNRTDFLIHGRGPKGSEGCIVIYQNDDLLTICNAVKLHLKSTGTKPILKVTALLMPFHSTKVYA